MGSSHNGYAVFFCTICGIIYPIEPAEPLNNAYHGGSFKSQLRAQRRIKKAVARFGAEQPPARLLTVRTMWETQKVSPGVPFGASGDFYFWDMEARQGSIPYNFVPGVSGKIRHAWRMQPPGNRSIFAWRLYHAAHPCKSAMVTPQAAAIFSRVDTLETALPDSAC